jgi:hypothetical protein
VYVGLDAVYVGLGLRVDDMALAHVIGDVVDVQVDGMQFGCALHRLIVMMRRSGVALEPEQQIAFG